MTFWWLCAIFFPHTLYTHIQNWSNAICVLFWYFLGYSQPNKTFNASWNIYIQRSTHSAIAENVNSPARNSRQTRMNVCNKIHEIRARRKTTMKLYSLGFVLIFEHSFHIRIEFVIYSRQFRWKTIAISIFSLSFSPFVPFFVLLLLVLQIWSPSSFIFDYFGQSFNFLQFVFTNIRGSIFAYCADCRMGAERNICMWNRWHMLGRAVFLSEEILFNDLDQGS